MTVFKQLVVITLTDSFIGYFSDIVAAVGFELRTSTTLNVYATPMIERITHK
jgi:hypothetical protein